MARPQCDAPLVSHGLKEIMCHERAKKTRSAEKEIYKHQIGLVIDIGFFIYGDIYLNFLRGFQDISSFG